MDQDDFAQSTLELYEPGENFPELEALIERDLRIIRGEVPVPEEPIWALTGEFTHTTDSVDSSQMTLDTAETGREEVHEDEEDILHVEKKLAKLRMATDFKRNEEEIAPDTEEEKEVPRKGKVGRRVKEITKLLLMFAPLRSSKVKKEYLRVELMRGFKRAIREVIEKMLPRKKIHGFGPKDKLALELWGHFRVYVRKHPDLFSLAQTEQGPCTEGKSKRKSEETNAPPKTFNDKFCRTFFNRETVREAFCLYLSVVFSDMSEEKLQNKFKFKPIAQDPAERTEVWGRLRAYLSSGMFAELGITAEGADLALEFERMDI